MKNNFIFILFILCFTINTYTSIGQTGSDSGSLFKKNDYSKLLTLTTDLIVDANTAQKWCDTVKAQMDKLLKDSSASPFKSALQAKWKYLEKQAVLRIDSTIWNDTDREVIDEIWEDLKPLLANYINYIPPDDTILKRLNTLESTLTCTLELLRRLDSTNLSLNQQDSVNTNNLLQYNKQTASPFINQTNYFLHRRDTALNWLLNISGARDGLYGLGLIMVCDPHKRRHHPFTLAGEFYFPVAPKNYRNPGLFLSGGIQHRSYIVLTGLGYMHHPDHQNLTWKITAIHAVGKWIGFGLSYSPALGTSACLSINTGALLRKQH